MVDIAELTDPDSPNGKDLLTPASRSSWRAWLANHPERNEGLWLVYRKKSSDIRGPDYDDLVEEALCFGWIDSVARRVDDDRRMQWFSPRRKGGIWSRSNKDRIERLTARGQMDERGRLAIEAAIADGSWSQTDEVDALIVPDDLESAFETSPRARAAYESLSGSSKRQYLWRIYSAKRERTRADRIEAVIRELSG